MAGEQVQICGKFTKIRGTVIEVKVGKLETIHERIRTLCLYHDALKGHFVGTAYMNPSRAPTICALSYNMHQVDLRYWSL